MILNYVNLPEIICIKYVYNENINACIHVSVPVF